MWKFWDFVKISQNFTILGDFKLFVRISDKKCWKLTKMKNFLEKCQIFDKFERILEFLKIFTTFLNIFSILDKIEKMDYGVW